MASLGSFTYIDSFNGKRLQIQEKQWKLKKEIEWKKRHEKKKMIDIEEEKIEGGNW